MSKSYKVKGSLLFSFRDAWDSFRKLNPAKLCNKDKGNQLVVDNAEKLLKMLNKQKAEYEAKIAEITKELEQAKHCNTPQFKDTAYMPEWSVYTEGGKPEQLKDHVQKFHIIHFVLKYKVLIPALMIFDRLFGKVKTKSIPDFWYNKNMIIHCKAYDIAERLWYEKYLGLNKNHKEQIKKYGIDGAIKRDRSCRLLRSIHGWALTGIMNDTAYKEFSNFYFHTFAKLMVQEYGGKGSVDHIMYLSPHIWDVNYCSVGQALANEEVRLMKLSEEEMRKKRLETGVQTGNIAMVEVDKDGRTSVKGIIRNEQENASRTADSQVKTGDAVKGHSEGVAKKRSKRS